MAKKKDPKIAGDETVAVNRRARFDYEISDSLEAGLVLTGTEVKSLRHGGAHLTEAYALLQNGPNGLQEVWVQGLFIPPYSHGTYNNVEPRRRRKLLLHRDQINRLIGQTKQKGFTLIPLKLYFTKGRAKLEIGVAKGRKTHDKRHAIAERETKRDMERDR